MPKNLALIIAKEVFAAMMATSCIFAVSALYGYKAEEDFGKYQNIIGIAVTSILLVLIANLLIGSSIVAMCISAAFICFHAFFIANSAQEIEKLSKTTKKDNIINKSLPEDQKLYCVYVAIGQKHHLLFAFAKKNPIN